MSDDGLTEALSDLRSGRTPGQIKTHIQEQLAKTGQAEGQCSHCGSFRADGGPPILHKEGCPLHGSIPEWFEADLDRL